MGDERPISTVERYLEFPPNRFGKRLRAAARAIESVHGVTGLLRIPVEEISSRNTNGEFRRHGGTGRPVAIAISSRGDHPELTLMHEVGHFLEQTAIPGHKWGVRSWGFDPSITGFTEAVAKTEAVAGLRNLHEGTDDPITKQYTSYLLMPDELWARCYAQYVAIRSGNPSLSEQLELVRSPNPLRTIESQWRDGDFKSVARAIDILFLSIGWVQ